MREVVVGRGRIFQWLMVPDVPSKAFLSFTQKTHCYSYHLLRGYCVFVCSPAWRPKVSAWCLLTSSRLFFETVSHWTCYLPLWWDWLASEPQESNHHCAAECWSYRCMPPCLPFMGDPQLWSQTLLCGKHFTHQSTTTTTPPDRKIIFPMERKINPKCKYSTEEFGTRLY